MIITILKEKLKEGISITERIAGRSLTLPILNNILISIEKNFLNLTSTDLEISINWWALVKTEKEGKLTVPAKLLSSFVNFLPNKPITLKSKEMSLEIECENYETSIKGFNSEDFPIIPKISKEENIVIKNQLFCQSLDKVVDFSSFSTTKPEISGVYLLFQKNLITMTATDSFRLGEKKLYLDAPLANISKDYSLILPQRAAKEIINIFNEKEGNLTIYFSPNQVLFETPLSETKHPHIQITSRLIDGEYPNYQEIIPKKSETKITLQTNEFINQVKLASLFSGKVNEVKLRVDPKKNQLEIQSKNPDIGEHRSVLKGKVEGKVCEISFNYKFLLDGLLSISSGQKKDSEVVLELTNLEKPGVLKLKGDDSYLYLVMPIKAN